MRARNPTPWLVFAFFVLVYGITARSELQVSDEVAVFATAVTLAVENSWDIDRFAWLENIKVSIGKKGPDGHLYVKYFPGNVLGAALLYELGKKPVDEPYRFSHRNLAPSARGAHLALGLNVLLGALAMTWLALVLERHYDRRTALSTVLLAGLCTDWWYQSRGFLSEVGAGTFLLGSLYFADSKRPWASGIGFATSLLFRPTNLVALPVWLLCVRRCGWRAAWSGLYIVAGLAVLGIYNHARFGSPFDFGYGAERFALSPNALFSGLSGLLFSPGRSVFVYSPILLLAVPGAWLAYRKDASLALACLAAMGAYTVTLSLWHAWHGGWTWGSRLLTPIVPLMGILLAPIVARLGSVRWLAAVTMGLASLGGAVQIVAIARDPIRVMLENARIDGGRFEETLYTVDGSWLAMQIRSLEGWQPCNIDAFAIHEILKAMEHCP